MAVPKKKTSKSARGMRCSHDALEKSSYVVDKKDGTTKRNHHIDANGFYKGRQIIFNLKEKTENTSEDKNTEINSTESNT
jgi:large subunit ribosomal protein L32